MIGSNANCMFDFQLMRVSRHFRQREKSLQLSENFYLKSVSLYNAHPFIFALKLYSFFHSVTLCALKEWSE